MKHAAVLLLAFAVSFAGCGGCQRAEDIGTSKEIMSGSMEKTGDTWHVTFKTKIDAPPDRVFEAFAQPERSREFAPDTVMKSELVSQNGNVKVVDLVGKLDILPPGFKVQDLRNELTLHPETKTITSKSVDFKLADITSEYKFEPTDGGKATIVTFTQTSKDKGGLPVESLQKGALRETYVRSVQIVNKALGLDKSAEKPAG